MVKYSSIIVRVSAVRPFVHLNILPLAQLSCPHRFLLPPGLLPAEHIQLSLGPPCLEIVPTFLALYPVLFQDAEKLHHLFHSRREGCGDAQGGGGGGMYAIDAIDARKGRYIGRKGVCFSTTYE